MSIILYLSGNLYKNFMQFFAFDYKITFTLNYNNKFVLSMYDFALTSHFRNSTEQYFTTLNHQDYQYLCTN